MNHNKKTKFPFKQKWQRNLILFLIGIFLLGACLGFFIGRFSTIAFAAEPEPNKTVIQSIIISPIEPEVLIPIEPLSTTYHDIPLSDELQDYIRELCTEKNIEMELVLAVIEIESNFRIDAISKGGDYGLMQINSKYHDYFSEKYGVNDFLDPYQNVYCGVSILAEHYAKYQDIHRSLMAYNMGASGAKRVWESGIRSTKYSEKVVAIYEEYKERS